MTVLRFGDPGRPIWERGTVVVLAGIAALALGLVVAGVLTVIVAASVGA